MSPMRQSPSRPRSSPKPRALRPRTRFPNSWVVEFRDDGFVPKRLEIEVGQQVQFVNSSESSLWPASNIHPTHQVMPEFRRPAARSVQKVSGHSRSISRDFGATHNHMVPEHSGLIVATGGDAGQPVEVSVPGRWRPEVQGPSRPDSKGAHGPVHQRRSAAPVHQGLRSCQHGEAGRRSGRRCRPALS